MLAESNKISTCYETYVVVFVDLIHSSVALFFCDNLTSIFHDNLVRFEAAVAAHSVTTVRGLDNLDTDTILAAFGSTSGQGRKGTVCAKFFAQAAVALVTLVKHYTVLAIVTTTVLRRANTFGYVVEVRGLAPVVLGIADESICK